MTEIDAQSLADQAVMLGLVERAQAREAMHDAADGSLDSAVRAFQRKGLLTSWQVERLKKGNPNGFFYGGCKVLFHLAEGTFARVYRGVKPDGMTPVAIKVLRQRFASDPASIERFNKEAEAGMKLRHPNIVEILEYGSEDRQYFMIMEYVEGANLRDFLKLRVRLNAADAMPLLLGMARGLKYSLDSGVTHRDIKGTNILVSNHGVAKLVDFGLATIETDDKAVSMNSQRTVDYSALERTCGSEKGDPRSDIYFLGCVFYQVLTGQLAMKEVESADMLAKMLRRSFHAIVPLGEHRHAPDTELSKIVEKMMRMDLKSRYQNMERVVADLEAFEQKLKAGTLGADKKIAEEDDFLSNLDEIFFRNPVQAAPVQTPAAPPVVETPAPVKPVEVKPVRKNLLCVESQAEIQDVFRKTLSQMGYRVILVGNADLAAERYQESPPDAVIFDVDGQGPEAIDALNDMHEKAAEDGHDLAALVILGPRQADLRSKLPTDERLVVLSKPLKMKDIQAVVEQLVPLH